MKKLGKFGALLLFVAGLIFASCSSDSGGGSSPANEISVPSYGAGKIIRNTVVSLNDSSDVYYEYLSFTSATSGSYALYKERSSENEKITSYTDSNGKAITIPTEFTYDASSGKFTAGTTSSYLFEVAETAVIAGEILSGTEKTLYSSWKSANGNTFTFTEDGDITVTDGKNTAKTTFTEYDGWIEAKDWQNAKFFWSSAKKLYFPAYETEREQVSEVGRSLAVGESSPDIAIVSSKFLLIDAAL